MTYPSDGVYTRIQPSTLHGVGVFAVKEISKGAKIFKSDPSEMIWIEERQIRTLPKEVQKLYHDFCVVRNGKLGCPKNFNAMTPSWYLNHSEKPNIVCDRNFEFFAQRDIQRGEELTVNYRTYSE